MEIAIGNHPMQLEFYSTQSTQATRAGGRTVSGALMEVRRGFFIDCTEQQSEPNVQMKASGQISMLLRSWVFGMLQMQGNLRADPKLRWKEPSHGTW